MPAVITRPIREFAQRPTCPRCGTHEGVKDAGPLLRGKRAYDIFSDTYGLSRCAHCGYRDHWIAFHPPTFEEPAVPGKSVNEF